MDLQKQLESMGACSDAREWVDGRDLATAWAECERGDWMLWYAGRLTGEPGSDARKPLVLAACECARLALKFVPAGEERPRKAIETAEAWANGDGTVTLHMVRTAVADAYAADAAYAAAGAAAAYAGAVAAYAGAASAYAYASSAALAAYYAYAAAASADIVRKHYPTAPGSNDV